MHEMFERHTQAIQDAINEDKTGEGFILDMFNSELANHEFSYTGDLTDALDALGMSLDEIRASDLLIHGLKLAMKNQQDTGEGEEE